MVLLLGLEIVLIIYLIHRHDKKKKLKELEARNAAAQYNAASQQRQQIPRTGGSVVDEPLPLYKADEKAYYQPPVGPPPTGTKMAESRLVQHERFDEPPAYNA